MYAATKYSEEEDNFSFSLNDFSYEKAEPVTAPTLWSFGAYAQFKEALYSAEPFVKASSLDYIQDAFHNINRNWIFIHQAKRYSRSLRSKYSTDLFPDTQVANKWWSALIEEPTIVFSWRGVDENLPFALSHLLELKLIFNTIISLEKDWDGEGALPADLGLVEPALKFILMYAQHAYKHHDRARVDLPDVSVRPNGTIDIHWTSQSSEMLLNVRFEEDKPTAFFYGEAAGEPVKGFVSADIVRPYLAAWLSQIVHDKQAPLALRSHSF